MLTTDSKQRKEGKSKRACTNGNVWMSRKEERKETSINFKKENIAYEFCKKRVDEIIYLMAIPFISIGPTEDFRGSGSWLLPSQEQSGSSLKRCAGGCTGWPQHSDAWELRRHHTTHPSAHWPSHVSWWIWTFPPDVRALEESSHNGLSVEFITQHGERVSVCLPSSGLTTGCEARRAEMWLLWRFILAERLEPCNTSVLI